MVASSHLIMNLSTFHLQTATNKDVVESPTHISLPRSEDLRPVTELFSFRVGNSVRIHKTQIKYFCQVASLLVWETWFVYVAFGVGEI